MTKFKVLPFSDFLKKKRLFLYLLLYKVMTAVMSARVHSVRNKLFL